jgi:hypothetical protein
VQAVCARIESAIKRKSTCREPLAQLGSVRTISHQPAPLKFVEDIHQARKLSWFGGGRLKVNFSRNEKVANNHVNNQMHNLPKYSLLFLGKIGIVSALPTKRMAVEPSSKATL